MNEDDRYRLHQGDDELFQILPEQPTARYDNRLPLLLLLAYIAILVYIVRTYLF